MRRVVTWTAGLALAVLALGLAVLPLQVPAFTRILSQRYSQAEAAGLTRTQTTQLAEQVRAFVVEREGTLPAEVAGRPGFDASAVSHLVDVADVIAGGRVLVAVLGPVLLALGIVGVMRGRYDLVAASAKAGGVLTIALPLVVGLIGVIDFDRFFSAFHALFFAEGTWTFPYDSLLIRLFPEPFWVLGAVAWALGVALLGVAFIAAGVMIDRRMAAAS